MVDDEYEVLGHQHGASVEGEANTLEQLHQTTDGEHSGFGHGLVEVLVEAEDRASRVAYGVSQQQALKQERVGRGGVWLGVRWKRDEEERAGVRGVVRREV